MITLENLTVSYRRHPAVHHVNAHFAKGTATAIFGPNGAGKSTLLKAMTRALPLDGGRVLAPGLAAREMAYLPQQSEIDRSLPVSVIDLVSSGHWQRCGLFGRVGRKQDEASWNALVAVGLEDFALRPVAALSSGQFQRVLFARILVQDAPLILLDEPFNAMDAATTAQLLQLVERWKAEGRTLIAVLHDEEQVKQHFPQTLLLAREVVAFGDSHEVLTAANLQRAVHTAAHWLANAPVCRVDGVAG